MVQRIFNAAPNKRSINAFDPLAISRAGQRGNQSVEGIFDAQDTIDNKQQQFDNKQSEIMARVETQRVEREFVESQFQSDQSEIDPSGVNFAKIGDDNYSNRINEARNRLQGDPVALQRFNESQELLRESRLLDLGSEQRKRQQNYWVSQQEKAFDDSKQIISRVPIAKTTTPQNNNIDGFLQALGHRESGNRTNIRNSEGFVGQWQMGDPRLQDFNRANGTNISIGQLQKSASLQEQTIRWHFEDIDNFIEEKNLDDFEGKVVNGVRITRNGMRAAAHLGGNGGLRDFLRKGKNPSDSNGTSLSDYMQQFGNVPGTEIPVYNGELPDIWKNDVVKAEREAHHENIDASPLSTRDKEIAKQQIDNGLAQAALTSLSEENPAEALALIRSGQLDDVLTFGEDQKLQGSLLRSIEDRIKASAKAQTDQLKDQARSAAEDQIAYQNSGRQGDAPRALDADERLALTPELRRNYEASFGVGQARVSAENAPIEQLQEARQQFIPAGEGFAQEERQLEAFEKVANQRLVNHLGTIPADQRLEFIQSQPQDVQPALVQEEGRRARALKTDFVSEAQRSGVQLQELGADTFSQDISARFERLSEFANLNGQQEVDLLTPVEKIAFTERFREAGVTDKMSILSSLSELPNDVAQAFFSDISDQSPFLAHMGGVLKSGNGEAVGVAMKGYQATLEGRKFDDLPKSDISLALQNTNASGALRAMPDVLADAQSFALNYARGIAQDSGEPPTQDHYEKGLNLALGNEDAINTHNGKQFVLPIGAESEDFSVWMESLDDVMLENMNDGQIPKDVTGRELDAEYIRENGELVTVGNGLYAVQFSDGTDAMNEDGSRLILDYRVKPFNQDRF